MIGGHFQLLTLGFLGNSVVQRTSTTYLDTDVKTAEQGICGQTRKRIHGGSRGRGAVALSLSLATLPAPLALL